MEGSSSVSHNKSILGIHIDDEFLNIVHLEQAADGLKIHNQAAEHLEAGVVKEGLIINEQTVSRKIRDFIKTNHIKTNKAILSLSFSSVRLKPSEFLTQTDKELRKQVEEQIAKYGLFGRRIVFDYCVFGQEGQTSNKQTVLEAVTTRQISDVCLAVAQKAGLELVRIEPAVLPVIKLVFDKQAASSDTVSLLLAMDSNSANLSVFRGNLPQLCQNLTIGVKDLSQDKDGFARLTDSMKPILDFAYLLADSGAIVLKAAAACRGEKLETIIGQIRKSISDLKIEKIDQPKIVKEFNVQGADGVAAPIFALSSAITAFDVCEFDGQLNLIAQESLAIQKTQKEMSLTAKAIAAIVLLSIAILAPLKMKIKDVEASSAEIEVKLTETIPMTEKITELKKQTEKLTERLSVCNAAEKKLTCIPWTKALQAIGDAVPDKVRIIDISTTDSGDFILSGEALGERYVYKFAKALQNNKFLGIAKVEELEYDDNNAADIVNYKIACKIQVSQGDL
jgi:Tfp pilus assembly PilM family ATPase/Tfp pilus assembly protein PilN